MTATSVDPTDRVGDQMEVVAFLSTGGAFGSAPVERVDTHAAHVFLSGDRAWKLKRAVRYGYLDFSTPARRRAALEAELRLNRRTAPDLYIALHPIVRAPSGLAIGGPGEPLDWLLEMRRFPDEGLLDRMADSGRLDDHLLIALADRIHAFHEAAEIVPMADGAARFGRIIDGNAESMAAYPDLLDPVRTGRLIDAHRRLCHAHRDLIDARAREGRSRHAHGDLHLANIAMIGGEPVPFDCLEFSGELATIDVLYDLAFLLMDLWSRGMRHGANLVFNRYIDLSADETGVVLLPLFLSVRATIRSHVAAARHAASGDAAAARSSRALLDLAEALLEPGPVALVAIGGLSGTGKSTLARLLAPDRGAAPGARVLRSDVLRKRLAGHAPEERLDAAVYTRAAGAAVYDALCDLSARHLKDGRFAFADAVFAHPDERSAIARATGERPFVGLWLEAPETMRVDRIEARNADASDATAEVARAQSGYPIGSLAGWTRIMVDRPVLEVARAANAGIDAGL